MNNTGYLSISGESSVTEKSTFRSNVIIGWNSTTKYDATISRNNYIEGYSYVSGNIYAGDYLEVSGNSLMKGNLYILLNMK